MKLAVGADSQPVKDRRGKIVAARSSVDSGQELTNIIHTPKHGSWLNVAECELSCMTSQCIAGRRIGELEIL